MFLPQRALRIERKNEWEQARELAGVPEIQIRELRRQYAIKPAESGAPMHDIQQVLGHASVATTEKHYAQFFPHHSAKKIFRVLQGGRQSPDTIRIHASGSERPAKEDAVANA